MSEHIRNFAQKVSARVSRRAVYGAGYCALLVITAYSAVIVKESRQALPLIAVEAVQIEERSEESAMPMVLVSPIGLHGPGRFSSLPDTATEMGGDIVQASLPTPSQLSLVPISQKVTISRDTRWFNGRPVRPAKTIFMMVTGYSPDARSCGDSADGLTATMHSVETNAFQLVAADPSILPYGSMLSVPGYAGNLIVPVLDCGSKIKGNHIDVLFKTHEQAMKWGVKQIAVTVWEYADGEPVDNPRVLR